MVAGDLVNTASRIQSAAEPGHGAGRRGDAARDRGRDRLRDAGEHELKGKAEPGRRCGARCAWSPAAAARRKSPGSRRPSSAATGAAAGQGALPRARGGGQGAARLGHRDRRASASRGWPGSSRSTSTASPRRLVAPRALPRLRGGRRLLGARRDGADARRDPRGGGAATPALAKLRQRIERARRRRRGASLARAAARPSARPGRAARRRPRGPLRGLAALLRAPRRAGPGGAGLRGPAVGRRRAPRLRRVPARVVAQPPDLRARAGAARAGRAPARLRGAAAATPRRSSLEPLVRQAMEELLDGFVPGLPEELRAQILGRAEGVPLYAVETVRMLLDRGLLAREGDVYRPTGPIEALDVPETLHALVAARLDGLAPEERRLLQDASVLGKSFTKAGLAALSGLCRARSSSRCSTSLVRKEVFSVQADPRSPERGQYSFLQDLLKRVAYDTLAKAERKARHLAAAAHLVAGIRGGRAGDRRGDRGALPRRLSGGAGRRRRARDQGEGAGDADPGGRARGLAGGERGGTALLRAGRRARRRAARRGGAPRARRRDRWVAGRSNRRGAHSSVPSSSTRQG